MRNHGLLVKLSLVAALAFAGGCASLQSRVVDMYADRWWVGWSVVNSLVLSVDSDGVHMTSVGRVVGPRVQSPQWETVAHFEVGIGGPLTVHAPVQFAAEIRQFLDQAPPGCEPPRRLLAAAISAVRAPDKHWFHSSGLPAVSMRLLPPGVGIQFVEASSAARVEALELKLVHPLPEARNCNWLQHWAADVTEMIVHEQVHMDVFNRFALRPADLDNELAASMVGLCVRLEVLGFLPDKVVLIPGGDAPDLARVLRLFDEGKISASGSGRIVADVVRRQAFNERALTLEDRPAMRALCEGVTVRMVDPRDPAQLQALLSSLPR